MKNRINQRRQVISTHQVLQIVQENEEVTFKRSLSDSGGRSQISKLRE